MLYTDSVVGSMWELNERTFDKKFKKFVTMCKDFGFNVHLDKYAVMKIDGKAGGMKEINYE
jgi:hypothetical protein